MSASLVATLLIGFALGAVVAAAALTLAAPRLMIQEDRSPHGHAETVRRLVAAAEARDWKVPTVHELDDSMRKAGHEVAPATVVELCRPDYAVQILREDRPRMVTSLMPCRLAVYRTADGGVVVSRMNTALMSRLFGGLVTRVMAGASADSDAIVAEVLAAS